MRLARAIGVGCAVSLGAVALASTSPAGRLVVGCKPEARKQIVPTRSYRFALVVGAVENMYMPYQVRASHLKHGEVMLRGEMASGDQMMHGSIHHLEIQICAKTTRAVVADANPTIVVMDNTTHARPQKVPVAVMEGIGQGPGDLHYGNNVSMPARHRFTVTVGWRGEHAVFRLVAPAAS
jgi:hypothetical protein